MFDGGKNFDRVAVCDAYRPSADRLLLQASSVPSGLESIWPRPVKTLQRTSRATSLANMKSVTRGLKVTTSPKSSVEQFSVRQYHGEKQALDRSADRVSQSRQASVGSGFSELRVLDAAELQMVKHAPNSQRSWSPVLQ